MPKNRYYSRPISCIVKSFVIICSVVCLALDALAFGGGSKSTMFDEVWEKGVTSLGIYWGGQDPVNITFTNCDSSTQVSDNGVCKNICGELTAFDSTCQTCTVEKKQAVIRNQENATCGTGNNWSCYGGTCVDPCTLDPHTDTTCTTYSAKNGKCAPVYKDGVSCGADKSCYEGACLCNASFNLDSNSDSKYIYASCTDTSGTHYKTTGCNSSAGFDWNNNQTECVSKCDLDTTHNKICNTCSIVDGNPEFTAQNGGQTCGENRICNNGDCLCDTTYFTETTQPDATKYTFESCSDAQGQRYKTTGCTSLYKWEDGDCIDPCVGQTVPICKKCTVKDGEAIFEADNTATCDGTCVDGACIASDPTPPTPQCSAEHLDLCDTETACEGANGHWCSAVTDADGITSRFNQWTYYSCVAKGGTASCPCPSPNTYTRGRELTYYWSTGSATETADGPTCTTCPEQNGFGGTQGCCPGYTVTSSQTCEPCSVEHNRISQTLLSNLEHNVSAYCIDCEYDSSTQSVTLYTAENTTYDVISNPHAWNGRYQMDSYGLQIAHTACNCPVDKPFVKGNGECVRCGLYNTHWDQAKDECVCNEGYVDAGYEEHGYKKCVLSGYYIGGDGGDDDEDPVYYNACMPICNTGRCRLCREGGFTYQGKDYSTNIYLDDKDYDDFLVSGDVCSNWSGMDVWDEISVVPCTSNAQCEPVEFCNIPIGHTSGTCTMLDEGVTFTYNGTEFLSGAYTLTRESADNWCKAHCKRSVSLADLGINPAEVIPVHPPEGYYPDCYPAIPYCKGSNSFGIMPGDDEWLEGYYYPDCHSTTTGIGHICQGGDWAGLGEAFGKFSDELDTLTGRWWTTTRGLAPFNDDEDVYTFSYDGLYVAVSGTGTYEPLCVEPDNNSSSAGSNCTTENLTACTTEMACTGLGPGYEWKANQCVTK